VEIGVRASAFVVGHALDRAGPASDAREHKAAFDADRLQTRWPAARSTETNTLDRRGAFDALRLQVKAEHAALVLGSANVCQALQHCNGRGLLRIRFGGHREAFGADVGGVHQRVT